MNSMNPTDPINPSNSSNPITEAKVKVEIEVSENPMNPSNLSNPIDQTNQMDSTDSTNPSNSSNSTNQLWYVIQTKPGNEERAKANLDNQGIETFLPLFETHQYSNGKIISGIKPLFPNYLFGKLDLELHYYKVKWTRGINKILGSGNLPTPVSEIVVQTIKDRSGADNIVKLEEELKNGDAVQVTSGPFKNLSGIFKKMISGKGRVKILLSLIGVDVPVQISKWQIKKVA
jgi:transcriptional antiterminator RfaH